MRLTVEQLFTQGPLVISRLVRPTPLQFRNHQLDKVHIAFRGDDACQVETIQPGFGDPRLQFISHLLGRANHGEIAPAQGVLLQQFAPGPVIVLQVPGRRLDRIALHVLDRLI